MEGRRLESLHDVQRDILRIFIELCERERLDYYAMFGTMIGAVRHGGFIPWDDDIDVAMPRGDYNRLQEMAQKINTPYFLQTPENDPGACTQFARLMRLDTTYFPVGYPRGMLRGGRYGCRIDILPLDEVPDKNAALALAGEAEENVRLRRGCAALEEMPFSKMPQWKQKHCDVPPDASYVEHTRRYHELCSRYSGQGAEFFTIAGVTGEHRALLLPKRCFETYVIMDFDDIKIRVPKGYDELSMIIYENGAELPCEKEREPKHKGFFDTDKSYLDYMPRYENVFCGLRGKKILLFGAGDLLSIFIKRFGRKYPPVCTFDNDKNKWGKIICGVEVRNPGDIIKLKDTDTRVIIVSLYHQEIGAQLEEMGIYDYSVFIDGWQYEAEE